MNKRNQFITLCYRHPCRRHQNQPIMNKLESLAVKLLNNIEKHTSLCENDYERNIFLQGVSEGYNAALQEHADNKEGWVRASDRLQNTSDKYFCKTLFRNNKIVGKYLYYFDSIEKCFYEDGIKLHTPSVVWLDEPLPSPPNPQL